MKKKMEQPEEEFIKQVMPIRRFRESGQGLEIRDNPSKSYVTIEGIIYSYEIFDFFASHFHKGRFFRMEIYPRERGHGGWYVLRDQFGNLLIKIPKEDERIEQAVKNIYAVLYCRKIGKKESPAVSWSCHRFFKSWAEAKTFAEKFIRDHSEGGMEAIILEVGLNFLGEILPSTMKGITRTSKKEGRVQTCQVYKD